MGENKSSNTKMLATLGILFVALVLGLFFFTAPKQTSPDQDVVPEPVPVESAETTQEPTAELVSDAEIPPAETVSAFKIDVNSALSDRVLGDTSAPVRIAEHASFSCSHCAQFHKTTFADLKKNYIDKGKAYLVFSDFPLDQTSMAATMISRCLPQDKYWPFVSMLFEKQEEWARTTSYLDTLKKYAAENGMNAEQADACLANKELQEGIQNRMKGVASQWSVSSTPSFVINNKATHTGALPYNQFSKIIDEETVKIANPEKFPAKEAPAEPGDDKVPADVNAEGEPASEESKESAAPDSGGADTASDTSKNAGGTVIDTAKDVAVDAVKDAAAGAADAATDATKKTLEKTAP